MAIAGSAVMALGPSTALAAGPAPAAKEHGADVPAGLERFYSQEVEWYPCVADGGMTASPTDTGLLCAMVDAPLDYADPEGETIEIAMKKLPASSGSSQGTLFINPGGPGGSGVASVQDMAATPGYFASQDVTAVYDVIGFDPRGIGASTPITCEPGSQDPSQDPSTGHGGSAGHDGGSGSHSGSGSLGPAVEDRSSTGSSLVEPEELEAAPSFAEVMEAYQQQVAQRAAQCEQHTRPAGLLDHVDTASVARDLDILRALSGQEDLDYLGYSYGTYLGATYAGLFPDNTGRIVLDGAVDPSLSLAEQDRDQAIGFEAARRAYVENCLATEGCPLSGDAESASAQLDAFINGLADNPVPTADPEAPLTGMQVESAITLALYSSEAWPSLTEGLAQAMNGDDGSLLAWLARAGEGAVLDTPGLAVTCLDNTIEGDMTAWEAQYERNAEAAPHYAAGLTEVHCQAWGHHSTREPAPIHAAGAAPILVLGTTGDPATPYHWSQALADQLESGRLLTWVGNGHVAYNRAGDCVNKAVDAYLLTGRMPAEGLVCTGDE